MGRTKTISDAELLERARRVFVNKGFAVSTKEVARGVGVSEGVLFQRYRTKADLFFAAMVLPAPTVSPRRGRGGRVQLEAMMHGMVDYFRETLPVLLPLMAHPDFRFEQFAARHPGSPLDVLRRDLVMYFVDEKQAGRLGSIDPGAAALSVFSVGLCVAFFETMGAHGGRFPRGLVERAAECLWTGLAPPGAEAPSKTTSVRKFGGPEVRTSKR